MKRTGKKSGDPIDLACAAGADHGREQNPEERKRWIDLVDQRHGERVPFIITESNEAEYVALLGGDRVASLGGGGVRAPAQCGASPA